MKKVSFLLTLLVALLVPSTAFAATSVKLNANCYNWTEQDFSSRTSTSDDYDWEWSGNYNNSENGFTINVDGTHYKCGDFNLDTPTTLTTDGANCKVNEATDWTTRYFYFNSATKTLLVRNEELKAGTTDPDPVDESTFYLNSSNYGYAVTDYKLARINGFDGFDYEIHVTGYNNGQQGFQIYDSATNKYWKGWNNGTGSNNVQVNGDAYGLMDGDGTPAWLMNNGGDATGDFWFYWNAVDHKVLVTTERRQQVFTGVMLFGDFENTNGKQWPLDETSLRSFAPNKDVKWESVEEANGVTRYYATFDFFAPKSNFRVNYNGVSYGPANGDKEEATSELTIEANTEVNDVRANESGHSYAIGEGKYLVHVYVENNKVSRIKLDRIGHTAFFDNEYADEHKLYVRGAGCFANGGENWGLGTEMTRYVNDEGNYVYYAEFDRIYSSHDEYNNQFKVGTSEATDWMWGFTSYNRNDAQGNYTDLLYDRYIGCPQVTGVDTNMSMGSDSEEGRKVYVVLIYNPNDPDASEIIVTYGDPLQTIVDPFENGLYLHFDAKDQELGNNTPVKMERDEQLSHVFKCTVYIPSGTHHFSFATAETDINNSHRFGPGESNDEAEMPLTLTEAQWTSGAVAYTSNLNDNGETPAPSEAGAWVITNDENTAKYPYTVEFDSANGKVRVYRDVPNGIEGIEAADSNVAPEYFNLQGVRVANPVAGHIYIVRRGNTVSKQIM